MLYSSPTPKSIEKPKWFKLPVVSRSKIVQFFKDAYQLDDESLRRENSKMKLQNTESLPSVGRKATE